MINYDKFKKSLEHLELQYNNYLKINERKNLLPIDKEAIQESVILSFENCYDTLWKHLKKYLEHVLGLIMPMPESGQAMIIVKIKQFLL